MVGACHDKKRKIGAKYILGIYFTDKEGLPCGKPIEEYGAGVDTAISAQICQAEGRISKLEDECKNVGRIMSIIPNINGNNYTPSFVLGSQNKYVQKNYKDKVKPVIDG